MRKGRERDTQKGRGVGGGGRGSHKAQLGEVMMLENLFLEPPSILSYRLHRLLTVCICAWVWVFVCVCVCACGCVNKTSNGTLLD